LKRLKSPDPYLEKMKKSIVVVDDSCVGCSFCMLICPYDGVNVLGKAEINDNCNACMKCSMYCPNSSIKKVNLDSSEG
jgi:Fe-S-cluster-containing hydrogenase component 2